MAKKKEAPAGTEEAEEAKKSPMKMIIIGVVLMVAGVFAGKTFFGGGAAASTTQIAVEVEHVTTVLDRGTATALTLEPVLVNLTDNRYLKMAFTVTVVSHEAAGAAHEAVDPEAMKPKYDKLRAEALSYLRGRTSTDVLGVRFADDLVAHLLERSKLWYGDTVADISIGDWIVS
jgi:flagellar basal body-associated protein FliL